MSAELHGKLPGEWVATHAARTPEQIAIVGRGRRISYAGLDDQINRIVRSLASLGVQRREYVAILLLNSLEFVVTFFAGLRLGAIALPMNPQYQETELERYLEQLRPKATLAGSEFTPLVDRLLANRQPHDHALISCPKREGAWHQFDELARNNPPQELSDVYDAATPALCLFSSGSTGGSKQVVRTQGLFGNCTVQRRQVA
jgi:acyl-CoA synthetase (AMP-forming)/AMP-acid ligase II